MKLGLEEPGCPPTFEQKNDSNLPKRIRKIVKKTDKTFNNSGYYLRLYKHAT